MKESGSNATLFLCLKSAIYYAKSKREEIKKLIKNKVIRIDKNLD